MYARNETHTYTDGMESIGIDIVRLLTASGYGMSSLGEIAKSSLVSITELKLQQTLENFKKLVISLFDRRLNKDMQLDIMHTAIGLKDFLLTFSDRFNDDDVPDSTVTGGFIHRLTRRKNPNSTAIARAVELFTNVSIEVGSIRQITFAAYTLSMQVLLGRLEKNITNGNLRRFLKLQTPEVITKLEELKNSTNPQSEKELAKLYKQLSRKAGFKIGVLLQSSVDLVL